MTPSAMLLNLLVSLAIACVGFWLKGFDSIFAKIGGWILCVFGLLGVFQAAKLLWRMRKSPFAQIETSYSDLLQNPRVVGAIDRTLSGHPLSDEDYQLLQITLNLGPNWNEVQEEFKKEVDQATRQLPQGAKMKEAMDIASARIRTRFPLWRTEIQNALAEASRKRARARGE